MSNDVIAKKRKNRTSTGLRTGRWTPTFFVLPAVILLFLITIVPFIIELILSLHVYEFTSLADPQFVWLQNYVDVLLHDARFWNAMKITFIFIIGAVGLELLLGVSLALLLNRLRRGRSLITSLLLIPVMIAPVVSGMMWFMIYDDKFGPLNYIIEIVSFGHFGGTAWLAQLSTALPSVMVVDIWQWTPFVILIALAGLQSIPPELYEAAEVDGCGAWQTLWNITLPMLAPVMVVGFLIRFMDAFKLFDVVYLLTRGGPGSATETISFYTYLRGFKQFSIGYTAALAFIQLIVIIFVSKLFIGYLQRQRGEEVA